MLPFAGAVAGGALLGNYFSQTVPQHVVKILFARYAITGPGEGGDRGKRGGGGGECMCVHGQVLCMRAGLSTRVTATALSSIDV